jgi:hypothetical protein
MNARTPTYMQPIDVHEALAHAHAERGAYISNALAEVPALLKRLVAAFRPHRHRLPHKGVCA